MLCIYVTCARKFRSSSFLAGKPLEYHEHVVMLINIAAEGNVNVKNLVQTIVQPLAFRETINSILTATTVIILIQCAPKNYF